MTMKQTIYFLCTGNSCRSQIAEGYGKKFLSDVAEIFSAGIYAMGVNPVAIQVMKEDGIDISRQTSETIDPDILEKSDYIITLCGNAKDRCPAVHNPKAIRLHWDIPDPVDTFGSEEEILHSFRTVRDEIKQRIEKLIIPSP